MKTRSARTTPSRGYAQGEIVFRILRRGFGYTKTRYRGIMENHQWYLVTFALVNPYMNRKRLVPQKA